MYNKSISSNENNMDLELISEMMGDLDFGRRGNKFSNDPSTYNNVAPATLPSLDFLEWTTKLLNGDQLMISTCSIPIRDFWWRR